MTGRSELAATLLEVFPLVDDHPDVAGLFRHPGLLAELGPALAEPFHALGVSKVLAPEARGPILGALAAVELGCGLVLARKEGRNHPGSDMRAGWGPGWRGTTEVFQARSFDLDADDVVLVVDDWITTGSSLRSLRSIVEEVGARYLGASVIVNRADAATLDELAVRWLVAFDEIGSGRSGAR